MISSSRLMVVGLILTMGMTSTAWAADDDKEKPENSFADLIGKKAPELKGPVSLAGKPVKLSRLKGKVVMLDFWAVWCGPCISTFPHLSELHDKYKGKGLEIVGLTSYYKKTNFDAKTGKLKQLKTKMSPAQERAMLKKFAAYHKVRYRLAVMTPKRGAKIVEDYEVEGIPHVVLIDRKGAVRMVKVGASKDTADALDKKIEELIAE